MLWFLWGFLTTSVLQEEQHGRTQAGRLKSVSGIISYLGAGQEKGGGYSRPVTQK